MGATPSEVDPHLAPTLSSALSFVPQFHGDAATDAQMIFLLIHTSSHRGLALWINKSLEWLSPIPPDVNTIEYDFDNDDMVSEIMSTSSGITAMWARPRP
ncbi:hypothetical protein PSACC_02383 [Paramicrosporidium saccamoebae]|uniref:Uncharacterized protein n=1 Tax=Paramicrosporidium saccamoebae TaxID=1246581 RepID=A0A2H9TJ65_9FUNG|nr:hypothetical protein PSACC_02383 [Paramicrosporidium saccamoebae]